MNKRKDYLDNISGLFIVVMILGHIRSLSGYDSSLVSIIELYLRIFMPWFFFKSGMFFKSKGIKNTLLYTAKKLLFPYILFSIIAIPAVIFKTNNFSPCSFVLEQAKQFILFGCTWANFPLWFLFSLSCVIIIFEIGQRYIHPVCIAIIGFMISYVLNLLDIKMPYYAGNISSGLFFFAMGTIIKEHKFNTKFTFGLFLFYFFILTVYPLHIEMVRNVSEYGKFIFWFPISIIGILSFNSCFKLFNKQIPIINYLGKYSMVYYVTHWAILEYFTIFVNTENFSTFTIFISMIITCAITIPFLDFCIRRFGGSWIIGWK